MVADDDKGYVYMSDERSSILKYHANPDAKDNWLIRKFALNGGIIGDREGLALYSCPDGKGYLLLSNQKSSDIKVYERQGSNKYVGTFCPKGSLQSDGLDATSMVVGSKFPKGILVAHNTEHNNFVVYDWRNVAKSLGLRTCAT